MKQKFIESPQSERNWQLILIYTVLVIFGIDVIGESLYDISLKYSTSEKEFNICLAQFTNDKCQISSLTERCQQWVSCMKGKKAESQPIIEVVEDVADIFVEEIK